MNRDKLKSMESLFSYGTLQQANVQKETFGRLLNGRKDALVGYILTYIKITDPHVIKASGSASHPMLKYTGNTDDRVEGTVFEITQIELVQADEYEVDDYQRVKADLASGNMAWVYAQAD